MLIRKTVVGSQVIERVTAKLGRKRYEVPVVFKWFMDGSVLTTEKRRQQLEAVQMAFEITGVQP